MGERGELKVNVEGNSAGFEQVMQRVGEQAKAFSGSLSNQIVGSYANIGSRITGAIAGFFAFDAVKSFLMGIAEDAKRVRELSEQFDISTDSVQKWEKATSKAGMTFGAFTRSLDTLTSKRQDARQDDKKLAPFLGLGFSEEDVRGNMSNEDMLVKILQSGGSRAQIADLLGTRGPRLKAALPYYQGATPMLDAGDIQDTTKVEQGWKGALGFMKHATVKAISQWYGMARRLCWMRAREFVPVQPSPVRGLGDSGCLILVCNLLITFLRQRLHNSSGGYQLVSALALQPPLLAAVILEGGEVGAIEA